MTFCTSLPVTLNLRSILVVKCGYWIIKSVWVWSISPDFPSMLPLYVALHFTSPPLNLQQSSVINQRAWPGLLSFFINLHVFVYVTRIYSFICSGIQPNFLKWTIYDIQLTRGLKKTRSNENVFATSRLVCKINQPSPALLLKYAVLSNQKYYN